MATPLSKYIGKIQAKELKVFVNARKWDVYSNRFRDFSELKKYLFDTTVILFRVAAGCERGKNEKEEKKRSEVRNDPKTIQNDPKRSETNRNDPKMIRNGSK